MKDNNGWFTQGIKISCKQTRSLYAFTNNSNNPKAKARYIKHCKILRKVIKVPTKQHYSRPIAKSNNNPITK
jgi:ribosomal protein L33